MYDSPTESALPMTQRYTVDPTRMERIKTWMQTYVDERKFSGSCVLVTQGGNQVFCHATGLRDMARGLPFTRDTIARIYSMTKPVTTVAMMMLVERGLIHLDAPICDLLPEFADMQALIPGATAIDQVEPCATPSLHQLMTHTSGFSYSFNPGVLARAMNDADPLFHPAKRLLAESVTRLARFPLAFRPGSRWEYSVGIDVVGRMVEILSGKSLARFFADEIFAPLGMVDTGFRAPTDSDRFAALYTPLSGDAMALNAAQSDGDSLRMVDQAGSSPFESTTMYSGGGGLVGTIDDYLRFTEMLRRGGACEGGRLLSHATLGFMRRNHLPGDIAAMGPTSFAEQPMQGMGFGLGGSVVLNPALTRVPANVGDFSWGGMGSTFFWLDPVQDINLVFFTQLSPSSSYPARAQLKALLHGALV